MLLALYLVFWTSWFFWVQTVGRLPYGLSLPVTLLFDALFIGSTVLYVRRKKIHPAVIQKSLFEWTKIKPQDVTGLFNIAAVLVLASISITAGFQVPLDWDGMDYHLPPLIEAWKNGSWGHSVNPYFAARTYPKTSGVLFLWWICHFGGAWGLPSVLMMQLLHWQVGLLASYKLFGRNKWVFLFWLAFPLAAREAVSGYADLAGLAALLAFCFFILDRKWIFATLAIALHGSIKFTNLASGIGALIGLQLWWWHKGEKPWSTEKLKWTAMFSAAFLAVASIQPLENLVNEGKIFGPLQCKILGFDFCDGTVDPNSLLVSPSLDFPKEQPWIVKVFRGWTPSQFIPGFDVHHGGFGWAWALPWLIGLWSFRRRLKHLWLGFARWQGGNALLGVSVLFFADLLVPGLWYPRYHMALGWVLAMGAAWLMLALEQSGGHRKPHYLICSILLFAQLLWIFPQRSWFLGVQGFGEVDKVFENIKSILWNGYPKYASHSADRRNLSLYSLKNKTFVVCGPRLRPILGAYGADLSNEVRWYGIEGQPACPKNRKPPIEVIHGSGEDTRYWILEAQSREGA